MDNTSFYLAIAGLASTIIASGIGFYYTHKARTEDYRSFLYQKQFDLIIGIMEQLQMMELDLDLALTDEVSSGKSEYIDLFNRHYLELAEMQHKGSIIFPVELYGKVNGAFKKAQDIVIKLSRENIANGDLVEFRATNLEVGLIAREFMGVDKLSTQSTKIFSTHKEVSKLDEMSSDDMTKLVEGITRFLDDSESKNKTV